jgi:ribosome biogenesis protein MAK21
VATQALLLLLQLMTSRNSLSDRFYRALYAVLASPELPRSTKAPMFLSLLFKALKADASPKRAAAFAKRVLQVALGAPPNFACGCLMLVSELLRERPGLWSAVLQPEDKEDDGVERFVDAPDPDAPPPAAVAALAPPGKGGRKKGAAAAVAKIDLGGNEADGSEREEEDGSEEEEEEEVGLSDSSDEDGGESSDEEEEEEEAAAPAPARAPARAPTAAAAPPAAEGWPAGKEGYDMRKRDPQFAHAERSCLWELLPLASHAHPSVAAQARALLAGANVSYAGDPLRDLTLAAFLDKFVAKKPKAATKGDSRMQPLRSAGGGGVGAGGAVGAAFASLAEKDVAPDDAFFHKYYSLQAVQSAAARAADRRRKKVAARAGDDEEALVSDAEDDGSDSDGLGESSAPLLAANLSSLGRTMSNIFWFFFVDFMCRWLMRRRRCVGCSGLRRWRPLPPRPGPRSPCRLPLRVPPLSLQTTSWPARRTAATRASAPTPTAPRASTTPAWPPPWTTPPRTTTTTVRPPNRRAARARVGPRRAAATTQKRRRRRIARRRGSAAAARRVWSWRARSSPT